MRSRLRRALPALIGLVLFVAALEVLRSQLRSLTWHALMADVWSIAPGRLLLALLLTAANYLVLTGYDRLAFLSIGKRLSIKRVVMTSFLAYAIANNIGFSVLSGASVRYRFYSRWGVSASELSRIVVSYVVTFWLGLLLVGGYSLTRSGLVSRLDLPFAGVLPVVGYLSMAASLAYVAASVLRPRRLLVGALTLEMPRPLVAISQLMISAADWTLAAAVLYVLLPASGLTLLPFLGAFLASQLLAVASHVPGGVGVFEGLIVLLLKPFIPFDALVPALVIYRAIYYLLPLSIALLVLVADEVHQRRAHAAVVGAMVDRVAEQVTPRLLSVFTFLAGVVLLFSGATPAAAGRLAMLDRVVPLGVIEASHFAGSIAGALLLILAQGLSRRLDAAYVFSTIGIIIGIAASLMKGADVEEALFLLFILLLLWRSRASFDRRAALFATRFSPEWIVAIAGAMGASLWLGLFAFKHVEFSSELWWQFELSAEPSRMLRASVGAAVSLLLFAVSRLFAHAPHESDPPSDADLADVARIIAAQPATMPYLVYVRDKAVLFSDDRQAFVMYGVQGRTWVALGDPVGPETSIPDMIREFLERCDDFGGVPVFYEISTRHLPHYVDLGLKLVKLGEEAKVDLTSFSLEGGEGKKFRQVVRRTQSAGATFRMLPAEHVRDLLPQLQAVSSDWLQQRPGGEKSFSLGSFKPDYLERFPVAVIEQSGRIVAFANVWLGATGEELSVDLMRFDRTAPRDVMEALFVQLMIWGKEQGYRWFAMGMAPLFGFERSPIAPLWNRLGSFVYEHGQAVYNFQGLRAYKEKFHPVWQPRYLAYPGGFRLPLILADVSALIAGGYRRIFFK